MKGYTEVRGVPVCEDDPNDESKVPQYATDLRFPEVALDLRMKRLDQLSQAKAKLKDIELRYVLISNDNIIGFNEMRRKLGIIRSKIDTRKLNVPCEMKGCAFKNPKISIYKNICDGCSQVRDKAVFENSIPYDLATIRNLILRISFLEEKISSSLSNQLTQDELFSFINEAEKISEALD